MDGVTQLSSFTDKDIDEVEAIGMHLHHIMRFMEALINEAKNQANIRQLYDVKRTFDPEEYENYAY